MFRWSRWRWHDCKRGSDGGMAPRTNATERRCGRMSTEAGDQNNCMPRTFDLAFLHELAADPDHVLTEAERRATEAARRGLVECDGVVARLGGRSGRLGECLVGTALLEGVLLALRVLGQEGVPVRLVVDAGAAELFDAAPYEAAHWPGFAVLPAAGGEADDGIGRALGTLAPGGRALVLDMHGGSEGMPALLVADYAEDANRGDPRSVTTLVRLFRTGVRAYADRGPLRRYADFVEDVFGLARGTLDGHAVQPTLRLAATDAARYTALAEALGLRPDASLVVAFFQSVVAAKCYSRWDEALALLCERLAAESPGTQLDVLLACGPNDEALPAGVKRADLEAIFGALPGTRDIACVVVATVPSLRDLAVLVAHAALALADDTGPGHIAGALGVPTVTPYLPGNVYSGRVWASSLHHRGVTLDPSPYTFEQVRDAVLWDSTHVIDSIPPEALASEALSALLHRQPA